MFFFFNTGFVSLPCLKIYLKATWTKKYISLQKYGFVLKNPAAFGFYLEEGIIIFSSLCMKLKYC